MIITTYITSNEKAKLEQSRSWLDLLRVSSKSNGQTATLLLWYCFHTTLWVHSYSLTWQKVLKFCERGHLSYLQSTTQSPEYAGQHHGCTSLCWKHLPDGWSFRRKKTHACTPAHWHKRNLRALKASPTWSSWAWGLIPSCPAPDLPCSPRSRGWYALLSSGMPWGTHHSSCTFSCLSCTKSSPMT